MALGNRLIEYLVVLIPTIQIVKVTIRFSTSSFWLIINYVALLASIQVY